jgi:hypothetical protein
MTFGAPTEKIIKLHPKTGVPILVPVPQKTRACIHLMSFSDKRDMILNNVLIKH